MTHREGDALRMTARQACCGAVHIGSAKSQGARRGVLVDRPGDFGLQRRVRAASRRVPGKGFDVAEERRRHEGEHSSRDAQRHVDHGRRRGGVGGGGGGEQRRRRFPVHDACGRCDIWRQRLGGEITTSILSSAMTPSTATPPPLPGGSPPSSLTASSRTPWPWTARPARPSPHSSTRPTRSSRSQ